MRRKAGKRLRVEIKSHLYRILVDSLIRQCRGGIRRAAKQSTKNGHISLNRFSLIDEPEQSLFGLMQVLWAYENKNAITIDFADEYCMDAGAYILFALLKHELIGNKFVGGRLHGRVAKVLSAMGLDQYARMKLPDTDDEAVWPMKLVFDVYTPPDDNLPGLTEQKHEKIALKITREFDHWLKQCGFCFNDDGEGSFTTLISEILDNARHATPLGQEYNHWAIGGFMAKRNRRNEGNEEYWCHLAFVTIGRSIPETLEETPNASVREYIQKYIKMQEQYPAVLDRSLLTTICSIQDSVTCDTAFDEAGGSGMASIINYARLLSGDYSDDKAARGALISGNSCLLLHPPYNELVGDYGRQQWFNDRNLPDIIPDKNYVKGLPISLPGTIFTLRFAIDRKFLTKQVSRNDTSEVA